MSIIAALGWIAGGVLVVIDLDANTGTAELGLYVAGVGAVLTVCHFIYWARHRESAAFLAGREAGVNENVQRIRN